MTFFLEHVTINDRSIAICYFSLLRDKHFRKPCLPTFGLYDSFFLSISLIACVCEYVDRMYTHSWTYMPTGICSPPDPWTHPTDIWPLKRRSLTMWPFTTDLSLYITFPCSEIYISENLAYLHSEFTIRFLVYKSESVCLWVRGQDVYTPLDIHAHWHLFSLGPLDTRPLTFDPWKDALSLGDHLRPIYRHMSLFTAPR